jgi:NTP pyrophosphatase (non-canonical NTP hydrolase)
MSLLLLQHFRRMQGRMQNYILPEAYMDREGNRVKHPVQSHTEAEREQLFGQRAVLFANDMIFDLDGPEQRAAEEEAAFDYVAETELTASNMDGRHQVTRDELRRAFVTFAEAAEKLDLFKKALFRGRNRAAGEIPGLPALPDNVAGLVLTDGHWSKEDLDLLHGIIGVATESGEMAEIAIKYLNNERPDVVNVREEIGDVLWYLARLVKWASTSFFAEMRRNIAKLRSRHGDAGFSVEGDKHRDLSNERAVLGADAVPLRTEADPAIKLAPEFPDDPHCKDA